MVSVASSFLIVLSYRKKRGSENKKLNKGKVIRRKKKMENNKEKNKISEQSVMMTATVRKIKMGSS